MSITTRRALVLGCGGTLGGAWTIAALKALADHLEWDPRTADVIQGTSAGAELATMLGSGISVDQLVAMQLGTTDDKRLRAHLADAPGRFPPLPRARLGSLGLLRRARGLAALSGIAPRGSGDPAWLERLAISLNPRASWPDHAGLRLVAMDYDTGERVAFGAPGSPSASVGEALQASWAIPGWFPPVEIDGRRYIDGGAASTASVDLLADDPVGNRIDEAIVIAPMASLSGDRAPGLLGRGEDRLLRRGMTRGLRAEITRLEQAATRVVVLDAIASDLEVRGGNLMDHRRREAVSEHALATLPQRVATLEGLR
ncbi:patatin-like phospholipase family protein [Hoyosella sp. G463]|uniref:Patatin-like phospholipase family protein n=1 Tax=Lolliginicoccus lacisalsi TaxID=2742202 RepID=A0A927JAG2_9ACTN|nr:patatin-like phospholipase family protein [Lolliginicoccus lacisalsi]MBD8505589.1 patatin-like phospholipase family protein [Lolliginicoccus lacisalsi]